MKANLIVIGLAAASLTATAMPAKDELRIAAKLVEMTMRPEQKALDARVKTRQQVAMRAIELAEKAETEAERLLYLKGAFELYAKDGNSEKAIETLGQIRMRIPDIPFDNLSNIAKAGVRSADKKTKDSISAFMDELGARETAKKVVAGGAPKVLKTVPANGDRNVDPSTSMMIIEFDQPMDGGYSILNGVGASEREIPEFVGKSVWNAEKTTFMTAVKLHPGRHYKMSINRREAAANFRSAKGAPLPDTAYEFWTTGELEPPTVVRISPENGAKDVDPKTDKIVVTFSEAMHHGWSVCCPDDGTLADYPQPGDISYDASCKVLTIPVSLEPGKTYKLQLNKGRFCNFKNKAGKPLKEYSYSFTTKAQ